MSEATLFEHMFVLYKRRLSVFIIVAVSAVTAVALSFVISPVYEARAVFFVPVSTTSLSGFFGSTSPSERTESLLPPTDAELMGPYFGLLKSRNIAERVNQDFPQKRVAKLMRSDMSFELSDEFLITVYSRDSDPELAAQIANAYVHHLNEILGDPATDAVRSDMAVLSGLIGRALSELQRAREKVIRFESQYSEAVLDDEIRFLTDRRSHASKQLQTVNNERDAVTARRKEMRKELVRANVLASTEPLSFKSSLLEELEQSLLEREITNARTEIGPRATGDDNGAVVDERNQMERALRAEFESLLASKLDRNEIVQQELVRALIDLLVEDVLLETSSSALSRRLDDVVAQLAFLSSIKVEWANASEDVERLRSHYDGLVRGMQAAELEDELALHAVVPVDTATVPRRPAFPILGVNLAVAIISGLLFGIVYAFAAEGLAKSTRTRRRVIIKEILREQ